jgi:phage terminase large subunit-like protein
MPEIIKPDNRIKIAQSILPTEMLSVDVLERLLERKRTNRIQTIFPESGPLRRELYPKHMEFLEASREHDETLFLAANKVGKSQTGGYATVLHATGEYPDWWKGKVFDHPTTGWICNQTATDCRDINQQVILGDPGQFGTGLLPKKLLIDTKSKPSVPDGVELIYVRHKTGDQSVIVCKSYDQGRTKFQGRNIHYIWADEEIPDDVYGECVMRLVTTSGIIFCTYTPVLGLTPVTVKFLTNAVNKDKLPLKFNKKDTDED